MQIIDEVYHQRGMVKKERKKKAKNNNKQVLRSQICLDVKIK